MRRIAVFCGSRAGTDPLHREAAGDVGRALARRGLGIVYGGSKLGLMGAVADAALSEGGEVIGVLPDHLDRREVAHERLTELHRVTSMHERKAKMAMLADGFVALPGGAGTMDELFEIWTWRLLGLHDKPCFLFDVGGYFAHLFMFADQMQAAGFLEPAHRTMIEVESDPEQLAERLAARLAPA